MGDQAYQNFQQHQQQYQNKHNTQLGSIVDLNPVFQEINNIDQGYINIQPPPTVNAPIIPTQKTFKYANDCSISIGCTPSGFTTILLHIRDTPYFGVGTIYSLSALELKDATIYYNSKHDFLLEEDIDPNSISPLDLDKDRRLHKICIYKLNETGEYRIDFVKLAKTGIEELDRQDPWKDFNDMRNQGAGDRQVEMMRKFINILSTSRNEPDIIVTSSIPEKSPDLKPCVGIMEFKRVQ